MLGVMMKSENDFAETALAGFLGPTQSSPGVFSNRIIMNLWLLHNKLLSCSGLCTSSLERPELRS